MPTENALAQAKLIKTMVSLGYPKEFAEVVATELATVWACSRMGDYIVKARPTHLEEIADELVAICDQRERFRQKAISQKANAAYTQWLNSPDREL